VDHLAPLASTAEQAAAWVSGEIQRELPPGWRVTGLDQRSPLHGEIAQLSSPLVCYGIRIPTGLDLLIFTWGNTDAGPLTIETATSRALVVDPFILREFGMGACLKQLFNNFPPNTYGLT
jgi:hypothetical protein